MKLAAIQLDTTAMEVNQNVHKAMTWGRRAFEEGADFVFFHEGLTADYTPDPMHYGRDLNSHEVWGFAALAGRYDGYVALGLNEVHEGLPYISCVYLNGDGVIDVYRKTYLWSLGPEGRDDRVPYKDGFRQELGILAAGDGPRNIQVGDLKIGTLICADGWNYGDVRKEAWQVFRDDPPDLIFYQNNRGLVDEPHNPAFCKEIGVPMVATNRCGFSYHHFQGGGTRIIRADGTVAAEASSSGEEGIIYAELDDLFL